MIHSYVFSQKEGRLISQDIGLDLLSVFLHDEGVQFWVDVGEATDEEAKAILDGVFHFHPLAIEDCLTPSDRPKVDEYEDCVFMIIHGVDYSADGHEFRTKEIDMFIGRNFLVTYHREPMRSVNLTMDRISKNAPAVARAPDRLTYTILDFLMENYEPALEELSREIADIEKHSLTRLSRSILNEVMHLKNQVQKLQQIVWPQREVITRLAHGEFKIVRHHMLPYYRDLLDQLVRISTRADNYRNALMDVLQVHLNLQQMEVNRIIKVLTVLATLSVPILAVTSFYGMNINHWPSFQYTVGEAYGWIFSITGLMTAALYWFLRRKGWW